MCLDSSVIVHNYINLTVLITTSFNNLRRDENDLVTSTYKRKYLVTTYLGVWQNNTCCFLALDRDLSAHR